MKNSLYNYFIDKVNLKITGINIERFIKRLKNNNIEILYLKNIKKGIIIKIYKKDYEKVLKLKTIYEIDVIGYNGLISIKNKIINNRFIIFSILICFVFLYLLTSLIFKIDIITNDKKMEEKIRNELEKNGISLYKFKKDYNKLQQIKLNIISKFRNEIEWIEIENIGTKYIIRYEPRIINTKKESNEYRNIIAKKDSVINDMYVLSGQIIKSKNTYVKKGDVIVSGYIYMNENIKDTVRSEGIIYGECWYNVTVTYPYKYYEEKETGNSKNIFVIKLINKDIELFNFNKYKYKKINNKTIIKNNLLPLKLVYQNQKEIEIINENNNEENVIKKAIEYSNKKINSKLKKGEYIKKYKVLSKDYNEDSITLNIFYSVIENITDYQNIEEYKEELLDTKNKE